MSRQENQNSSVVTKIRQAYWEAKRNFTNSLGKKDDDCLIANDLELDTKIEFLEAADFNFNALLNVLLQYNKALTNLTATELNLSSALLQYGCKDTTKAGKLMSLSGKCLNKSAHKRASLKTEIMQLYCEIETFQFKATVDVFQTVHRMEKRRSSYRSGLMWMKNESQNLDPDMSKKLSKFKKVQEHIKNLKIRYDRAKLETMQKIDLYLLSRCNLFSQNLSQYRKAFCKMSKIYANFTNYAMQTAPHCFSFKFEILKELNNCSRTPQEGNKNAFNLVQNLKSAHDNFTKLSSPMNSEARSNLVRKSLSSGRRQKSSKSDMMKKVRFYDCAEAEPQNRQSTISSFSLLIDLNEETENKFNSNGVIETNQQREKYSDDLLSINFNTCHLGSGLEESREKGDFQAELGKCIGVLENLVKQPTPEKGSELHFWNLMTNFENLEDDRHLLTKPMPSAMNFKNNKALNMHLTNPSLKSKSPFHLENVLMEFDPFVINKNKIFKEDGTKEDC